jgi:AcrR family transcriptional regulator
MDSFQAASRVDQNRVEQGVGKRAATKAQNRSIILAAAHDVFAELGYDVTTVRDIIRRTPLASGTFYNYFPDKESIFRAVVEESMRHTRERLRRERRAARTFEEFVTAAYRTYFTYIAEDRATFELMRRNADAIRALTEIPEFNAGPLEVLEDTRDAIARGLIRHVDAEFLAGSMAAVAIELGIQMVRRDPIDVAFTTRFASALFLGSIQGLEALGNAPGSPAA